MVVPGFILPRSLRRVFFEVLCGSRESMCYVAFVEALLLNEVARW